MSANDAERGERIAKWLARAGVASRRDVERMVADGRVRLNNQAVTHPATFVKDGDVVQVKHWRLSVLEVPGHTRSHIAFHGGSPGTAPHLFCGDTLFSLGCGRPFSE